MQWSKLKERVQESFAPSLVGRVAVYSARYSPDHARSWITIDGREVASMSDHRYEQRSRTIAKEVRRANHAIDFSAANQKVIGFLAAEGTYSAGEFNSDLFDSLSLSLDAMIHSDSGIIRALAMLDSRLGKRRLRTLLLPAHEIPLVRTLYVTRCEAEGVSSRPDPTPEVGKCYLLYMRGEVFLGTLTVQRPATHPDCWACAFDATDAFEEPRALYAEFHRVLDETQQTRPNEPTALNAAARSIGALELELQFEGIRLTGFGFTDTGREAILHYGQRMKLTIVGKPEHS